MPAADDRTSLTLLPHVKSSATGCIVASTNRSYLGFDERTPAGPGFVVHREVGSVYMPSTSTRTGAPTSSNGRLRGLA
jgi:hypothetical protein